MARRLLCGFGSFVILALSPMASASDGVLEIDQACATATGGCFPGDAAGFPVTIAVSGSYRLTGELVASGDASGIEILASEVSLDLGGFSVRGARPCTGTPPDLVCPSGIGRGIAGSASNTRVANGTITGFAGGGLDLGADALVSNVAAHHNGQMGISVGDRSRVMDSEVALNGGVGIRANDTTLIHRCSSSSNLDQAQVGVPLVLDSLMRDGPGGASGCFADAFEPNQTESTSAVFASVDDADTSGGSLSAELGGSSDADWFSYQLNDSPFGIPDPTLTLTLGGPLRMCIFYECASGTLALTCPAASTEAISPSGRVGCCTTGSSLQILPDCGFLASNDSGTVFFRIDSGPAGECSQYALSWHP